MKKSIKYFLLILVILGSLFFLFGPEVFPEPPTNVLVGDQELLNSAAQNDVIIIFNSGGWGNTPLEEAEDFAPIIEKITETLNEWGYNSLVIPYTRTKDDLSGKITGTRDFLNSFQTSSEILAEKVNFLTENLPDKKIIMAGLSAGGALVDETMERISGGTRNSVYAITAGIPFWEETLNSENILQLNNNGRDSLAAGDIKSLIFSLIKAPFKWISSKINGQNLPFSQALQAPGHDYLWSSPEVGPQIVSFLENKIR